MSIFNVFKNSRLQGETLRSWKEKQPSSFSDYLKLRNSSWVKTNEILNFFDNKSKGYKNSYESFVVGNEDFEIISKLLLE